MYRSIYYLLLITLILSCGKEELGPKLPQQSTPKSLAAKLDKQSYFKKAPNTIIVNELLYEEAFISREENTITFKEMGEFTEIDQYTYITYPFFSERPENFFSGRIIDSRKSNGEVTLTLESAKADEIYDDYFINTSRPTDIIYTRTGENVLDIGSAYTELESYLQTFVDVMKQHYKLYVASGLAGSQLFKDMDVVITRTGGIAGGVTFLSDSDYYTLHIADFALDNFGFEMTFKIPEIDLDAHLEEIKNFEEFLYNAISTRIEEEISGLVTTANYNVGGISKRITGTPIKFQLLYGALLNFSGGFSYKTGFKNNTLQPIDLTIEISKLNPSDIHISVNGVRDVSLTNHIHQEAEFTMVAKAAMEAAPAFGMGIADELDLISGGLLLSRKYNPSLRGQIATYLDGTGDLTTAMTGCAGYKVTDHALGYVTFDTIRPLSMTELTTIELGSWPVYDIAKDPQYVGDNPSISYTEICYPDNCKAIDENNSYFTIDAIQGTTATVSYYIASDNAGKYDLSVEIPGVQNISIASQKDYNTSGTLNIGISNQISTALKQRDLNNFRVLALDNANQCTKYITTVTFAIPCEGDTYVNGPTGLEFRSYNLNASGDNLNTNSCADADNPIWVYNDINLTDLHGLKANYSSHNYMTPDQCECFAERLSENGKSYRMPTTSEMVNFISANSGVNFSFQTGKNEECANFLPTGYIVKKRLCVEFISTGSLYSLDSDFCLNNPENSYFLIDSGDDKYQLFEVDSYGNMNIRNASASVIAPCRLIKE